MRAILAIAFFFLLPAHAAATSAIERAIHAWFERERLALPGPASIEIGPIVATTRLPPCQRWSVERPASRRSWGATQLLVRCDEGSDWRLFVPVTIHVRAPYLVTARPIAGGKTIEAADILMQEGDLAELPANVLMAPEQAIGRIAAAALIAGQPLRADQLRPPRVIEAGQNVLLVYRGESFTVRNEGKALASASAGQTVNVRLSSGQIVSGIAQADGTVLIR